MKQILLSLAFLGLFVVGSEAIENNAFQGYGTLYSSTAAYTTSTISSSTVTTIPAIYKGMRRIIDNQGDDTVYRSYNSTINVTTTGLSIDSGEKLVEDMWFGVIYFQSVAGSTGTITIEEIKEK